MRVEITIDDLELTSDYLDDIFQDAPAVALRRATGAKLAGVSPSYIIFIDSPLYGTGYTETPSFFLPWLEMRSEGEWVRPLVFLLNQEEDGRWVASYDTSNLVEIVDANPSSEEEDDGA